MKNNWDIREVTGSGRSYQPNDGWSPASVRRAATPSAWSIVKAFLLRLLLDRPKP